jgi:dethiobiotin synthetase
MKAKSFFVTGTDTGVGKTYVSCALLQAAKEAGLSTAAIKPIAAGGEKNESGIFNEDALKLQSACTLQLAYQEINPLCLQQAIAPHIAAKAEGVVLDIHELANSVQAIIDRQADLTLIEGAGGWRVPMDNYNTLADLARLVAQPVILVVGMRLGCLNHALLSMQVIRQDGVKLHGWIANQLDPAMSAYQENLETLKNMIDAPLLGELKWQQKSFTPSLVVNKLMG